MKKASGGVTKQMPTSKDMGGLGMAKGGGIEKKGKTKASKVKMAGGGKCYAKGGSIDGIASRGKTRCKTPAMAMGGMASYKRGGKTC
jgi:hypothetical protein